MAADTVPGMDPAVVELRQYTLRPRQREVLVELFDREFVESQEALGMRILGQFRDLDRADRFVWLRGFADLQTRLAGLTAFYGGPVWKAHSAAANATMLDVDDVLLLRPAGPGIPGGSGAPADSGVPAGAGVLAGDRSGPAGLVTATVHPVADEAGGTELLDFLHAEVDPVLATAGRRPVGELRTLAAVNDYPALPVREGEHVVVRLARHDGEAEHRAYRERLDRQPEWRERILPALLGRLTGPPQHLRLQPTPRSALR